MRVTTLTVATATVLIIGSAPGCYTTKGIPVADLDPTLEHRIAAVTTVDEELIEFDADPGGRSAIIVGYKVFGQVKAGTHTEIPLHEVASGHVFVLEDSKSQIVLGVTAATVIVASVAIFLAQHPFKLHL